MKKTVFAALMILPFIFFSCKSGKKSDEIKNYSYQEESKKLSPELQSKLGGWFQEGAVCYGLVIGTDKDGKVLNGITVKAKVVEIRRDSIKMKALEKASLSEVETCSKLGLNRGSTWWEKEGDLFQTKEEAEKYLKDKGWFGGAKVQSKHGEM